MIQSLKIVCRTASLAAVVFLTAVPSWSADDAGKALVGDPVKHTFGRRIGDM